MTYDEIMKEITTGLTGDYEKDKVYLWEQAEKYKGSEFEKEILRACGRLFWEISPAEMKNKITDVLSKENLGTESILEEAYFNQFKKDYAKALGILEPFVQKIEKFIDDGWFVDDAVSEYFCFNEWFEELLYSVYNQTEKTLRRADIPYAEIYLQYGSLLIDLNRIEDARTALQKAMRWNPASVNIQLELAETYKLAGNREKVCEIARAAFKYAFRKNEVAKCYRTLGWYFVEEELYQEAVACYALSSQFEKSDYVQSELYFISQKTNGKLPKLNFDEITKIAEKYNFPPYVDSDVLNIAFGFGKKCMEEKIYGNARYLFSIVYDLTGDDDVKEILNEIDKLEQTAR